MPSVRNVIFDVGGVLLEWDPPAFIAQLHPDAATAALIRQQIFEHPDWHEFDRGAIDLEQAIDVFGKRSGLGPEQMSELLRTANDSLRPIAGTLQLLDDLAAADVPLYLLSNMPVSTYEYLVKKHAFFKHFRHLVISGAILMIKPQPAIYQHLVDTTGIVPAESVFIDDLLKNVIAARECGLHAIQFRGPDDCRAELRDYLPHAKL